MSIIIKDISKSFDGVRVLENISANLPPNGLCNVCGVSGSGKTTLLRIIMGLIKPDTGFVDSSEISFSPVFPEDRLLDTMTAYDNVRVVNPDSKKAMTLLVKMGLAEFVSYYPRELSTGMKRRVALARALAFDADVLVLDEPFKGVDQETCQVLLNIIVEYSKNKLVILVDHNQHLVLPVSDYKIKLKDSDNR